MNLFIFPQVANDTNGYSIIVKSDYKKLNINSNKDKVIWYRNNYKNDFLEKKHIKLNTTIGTFKKVSNAIRMRPSMELHPYELSIVKTFSFDNIFCGDTIIYRGLRNIFPNNKIMVRFHNSYWRIGERLKKFDYKLDLKFKHIIHSFSRLEREIFKDENTIPIFLSKEDQEFFTSTTGREDSLVWGVEIDESRRNKTPNKAKYSSLKYLIYFGGIESHKKMSIDYFIANTFPHIKANYPDVHLKIFGLGTEIYNDESAGVLGYGRYEGDDFPHFEDGLYLNPDLTGGGVKIKVKTYIENNIRFISTPFGYEGYSNIYVNNDQFCVEPFENWSKKINELIDNSRHLLK